MGDDSGDDIEDCVLCTLLKKYTISLNSLIVFYSNDKLLKVLDYLISIVCGYLLYEEEK